MAAMKDPRFESSQVALTGHFANRILGPAEQALLDLTALAK